MGEAAPAVAAASYDSFFWVGECKGQKNIDGEQVPLVLKPRAGGQDGVSHEALVDALRDNREWVEGKVVANSAVLMKLISFTSKPKSEL